MVLVFHLFVNEVYTSSIFVCKLVGIGRSG